MFASHKGALFASLLYYAYCVLPPPFLNMALRELISMAVVALDDLVPVSPDELEIILKALQDEGVEEAVDVRLAYGGVDGKKAAEVFAKNVSIPNAFEMLRFTAENVSEADMKVLDMQAKPAEPRRRRFIQDAAYSLTIRT